MRCRDCELHRGARAPVAGEGPESADLMIVGEAPGADEDRGGRPFIGKAGRLLDELLEKAGLDRRAIYITNVVKCRPPGNKEPGAAHVKACLHHLQEEVKRVAPKVIVTLGNAPLKALTGQAGITKARGVGLYSNVVETEILPTFHPAAILHGREEYRGYIVSDLQKAATLTGQDPGEKIETRYRMLRTAEEVEEMVIVLRNADAFTYDIEATGLDPRLPTASVLALGVGIGPGIAYTIPLDHPQSPLRGCKRTWEAVWTLLRLPALKIAHNAKYDIQYLEEVLGLEVADPIYDTMLAHYLLDVTKGTHGLKSLVWGYTDMGGYERGLNSWFEANGMKATESRDYSKVPIELLAEYCAADCDATFRLYERFDAEHTPAQRKLMSEFFAPATRVMIALEREGFVVDRSYMEQLDRALPARKAAIEAKMREDNRREIDTIERLLSARELKKHREKLKNPDLAKPKHIPFNFGSVTHLRMLLFDELRLPNDPAAKKATGPSTDEDAINFILDRVESPLVEDLLDWRKVDTLHGTFVKGIAARVSSNGRVHGNFNLHGTETGRLSSSGPNMQNIPRTPLIKNEFTCPHGYKIVQADFGQIELRVAAMMSKDAKMMERFASGGDIHRETASRVYASPPEDITKEQRNLAKKVGFGILYGRGPKAIAAETSVPVYEAKKFIKDYFEEYDGVAQWISKQHRYVRRHGYVTTPFGRLRRLPGAKSRDRDIIAEAERQSVNTPVQSIASDITVRAMIRLYEALPRDTVRLVSNVHDSVIMYIPDDAVPEMIPRIRAIMIDTSGLPAELQTVPLTVDIEVGTRWGSLEEWGDDNGRDMQEVEQVHNRKTPRRARRL